MATRGTDRRSGDNSRNVQTERVGWSYRGLTLATHGWRGEPGRKDPDTSCCSGISATGLQRGVVAIAATRGGNMRWCGAQGSLHAFKDGVTPSSLPRVALRMATTGGGCDAKLESTRVSDLRVPSDDDKSTCSMAEASVPTATKLSHSRLESSWTTEGMFTGAFTAAPGASAIFRRVAPLGVTSGVVRGVTSAVLTPDIGRRGSRNVIFEEPCLSTGASDCEDLVLALNGESPVAQYRGCTGAASVLDASTKVSWTFAAMVCTMASSLSIPSFVAAPNIA
mmetsp:Transcript_5326/g.13270  ORF Transcript_5326/g.13270 Transcript_5326/m.13270 type:complete len:280 (+) Transcript_5326:599-1438(+)